LGKFIFINKFCTFARLLRIFCLEDTPILHSKKEGLYELSPTSSKLLPMFAKPKSPVFIDSVLFEVDHLTPSSLRAILKDETGSVMGRLEAEVPVGQKNYRWNGLNDLPYGVYELEMRHGEEETRMKLVKRI
jgi:hypothetical protein